MAWVIVSKVARPQTGHFQQTLFVDVLTALLADADVLAGLVLAMRHARGLLALGANDHDVGDMDGSLDGHDAALGVLLSRAHGLLDHVHLLDDHTLLAGDRAHNLAFLALVLAGQNADGVALLDVHAVHCE